MLDNGKYYVPAKNHYQGKNVTVVCDRCRKNQLDRCIGYDDNGTGYDLCMKCVGILDDIAIGHNHQTKKIPSQEQFKPVIMTNMMQEQFRPERKTYMMQEQFEPVVKMSQHMYR
jgi:hypothetical protein